MSCQCLLCDILEFIAFFAAESVAVGTEVLVVESKGAECLVVTGQHLAQTLFPVGLVVVGRHIPRVVGNAIEGNLGGFGVLHRVADEARHGFGNVKVVAIGRTEEDVVAHEVAHGEVPPDIGFAVDALVDPFLALAVNAVHHGVACPHNFDALVHLRAEGAEVAFFVVGPSAVVFRGAHNEGRNVVLLLDEVVVHIVEEFGLLIGSRAFAPDIVEEYGERAHAEVVHLLEFGHEVVAVLLRPFDIHTRMDGPVEVHAQTARIGGQFADALGLGLGIGFAPLVAVPGVVLRTIYIYVHFVAGIEGNLAEACLVAPGCTIKSLNHAAIGHVGIVRDGAILHFALTQHSHPGLGGPEEAHLVGSRQHSPLGRHLNVVALGLCGNFFGVFLDGLIAFHTNGQFESSLRATCLCAFGLLEQTHNILVAASICGNGPRLRGFHHSSARLSLHLMGHRIDQTHLSLHRQTASQ